MAFGSSQIDTGSGVGLGLRALSFAPGPLGLVGTLAGLGMRGNNLGYSNRARASWGQGDLDFGQTLGALAGLNSYGRGGGRDKLGEFRGVDVTPSGVASRGGFLGIGADTVGAYTPGEAQKRAAAARYGSPFGTPQQGPVQPSVSAPATPSVAPMRAGPMPQARPAESGIRDMSRFRDDPDPIGSAIRSMGGSLWGGGRGDGGGRGNGGGGGGGGNSGGGRSDHSSMSSGRG